MSGFPGYESTVAVPTIIQVLNGEKPTNTEPIRVDVEPGRTMRYSGGGFTVMQLLVGDITGKAFPQAMREFVLDPVGMTASTYEQPLPAAMRSRATLAYQRSGEPVTGGPHTYPEMAAAGLWTTPSDLAKVALDLEAGFEPCKICLDSLKALRSLSVTIVSPYPFAWLRCSCLSRHFAGLPFERAFLFSQTRCAPAHPAALCSLLSVVLRNRQDVATM